MLQRASDDLDNIYNHIVSIRRTGAFANRGYRQIFTKNFTIVYRIDEAKKMIVIVTVRYTPGSF